MNDAHCHYNLLVSSMGGAVPSRGFHGAINHGSQLQQETYSDRSIIKLRQSSALQDRRTSTVNEKRAATQLRTESPRRRGNNLHLNEGEPASLVL